MGIFDFFKKKKPPKQEDTQIQVVPSAKPPEVSEIKSAQKPIKQPDSSSIPAPKQEIIAQSESSAPVVIVQSNKPVASVGKPAHNQAVSFYPSLTLHEDLRALLWIGDGPFMNLSKDDMASDKDVFVLTEGIMGRVSFSIDEPSLIYTEQVITKPEDESVVSRPPYFPKYTDLSPEQRYIYLKLLSNPYNTNIDVGYVFILYYGLERHLLQGNFDAAFQVILKLRDVHNPQRTPSAEALSGQPIRFVADMPIRVTLPCFRSPCAATAWDHPDLTPRGEP